MGQMAYGGGHIIMLPVIQDQRNCPHRLYQRGIPFHLFLGNIRSGGKDIIGVFQ